MYGPKNIMELSILNLLSEGPISYREGWERQRELVALRQQDEIPDTLILLEHTPTVTYGKTTNPAHLLLSEDEYAQRGIELIATDRGGDVTYHGPGQLVGYPILHLGEGRRDLHRYVRTLEDLVIQSVTALGVEGAGRAPWHAGVWVGNGYLAALGVKVSRWVTHHGLAINVSETVHSHFSTIIPCGVAEKQVVTVNELIRKPVALDEAASVISRFAGRTLTTSFLATLDS